jgi:hypothetical protein
MRRRNRKKRSLKKSCIVLVDGESEISYINNIKTSNLKVLPEIPKNKSLKEMYKLFREKAKEFDIVFWIIDLDVVIRENNLSILKDYIKNYEDNIIINNPCLEYWFYLHFPQGRNFNNSCDDVISSLKKIDDFFKNYTKSSKNIKKLAEYLKPRLSVACKNAKNRECCLDSIVSCSQMYKLIRVLLTPQHLKKM